MLIIHWWDVYIKVLEEKDDNDDDDDVADLFGVVLAL